MTYLNNMTVNYSKAPEHLLSLNWLELEKDQAWLVFADLEKMVGKLEKKLSERRVHDVRVTLRRWYSVWDILAVDGWENSGYPDGGFEETIGRYLIKLGKNLGQLRDLDVSLNLARDLHLNQFVVRQLSKERKKLKRKVEKKIGKLKLEKLIGRLRSYLTAKSNAINYAGERGSGGSNGNSDHSAGSEHDSINGHASGGDRVSGSNHSAGHPVTAGADRAETGPQLPREASAYFHLNQFLLQSEHQCRLLCEHDKGNEELHELRLSIKRWRYLLTEFFGLTNIDLVSAQQILGRIRDFNRLDDDLKRLKRPLAKAIAKNRLRQEDLKADKELIATAIDEQFVLLDPVLRKLPFGLRPYVLSL